MSASELKPCEKCGGEGRQFDTFMTTRIICIECLNSTKRYKTAKEAIAAWNRRAEKGERK